MKYLILLILTANLVADVTFDSLTNRKSGSGYVGFKGAIENTPEEDKSGVDFVFNTSELLSYDLSAVGQDDWCSNGTWMTKVFLPPHLSLFNISFNMIPNNNFAGIFFYRPLDDTRTTIDINNYVTYVDIASIGKVSALIDKKNVFVQEFSNTGSITIKNSSFTSGANNGGWLYIMFTQMSTVFGGAEPYNPNYVLSLSINGSMIHPFTENMRQEILDLIPAGQTEPNEPPFQLITKECNEPKTITVEVEKGDEINCYIDSDNDGYGKSGSTPITVQATQSCQAGYVDNANDCNDNEATAYNNATEIVGDGIKQQCNDTSYQEICYLDNDNDGKMPGNLPLLTINSSDLDCNDAKEVSKTEKEAQETNSGVKWDCDDNNANKFPGNTEIPNDGIDQDCSGADLIKCYVDSDHDGEGNADGTLADYVSGCPTASGLSDNKNDCDDSNQSIKSSATELAGNEVDENCDEKILCYVDGDNDDFSINQTLLSSNKSCGDSGESITLSAPIDCNDASPSINPSKPQDTLVNGISQNCDNLYACYKDEDNDDIGTNEIVLSTSATCNEAGMTYNLYNGAGFDNCPTMDNPDQKDSNGNDIGDVCDRPFTSLLSSSDSDVGTLGSYEKILEEGDGHITFNKDITFSNDNFKRLERIYIPPSAVEATIVFTNKSEEASSYTEIYSKFGAVSNYIDLYSPFQRDSEGAVNLRSISYDRQSGDITFDDYEDLLAMDITTRVSGKSISYNFSTDMLKRYVQHGEWLYFIIKQTEGLLNISYDVNVNLQSDIDKYNFNIWSDEIKNGSTNDDAAHIVVRKDLDTVDDYIFEDDFNSSNEYMSIHDIRASNGHRGLKAHAESTKLTNYIKHTYHALIDQKDGVGTNKFKAYIPKNSSVNLYIATKPIDGDIAVRIRDGASEVFNGTMKNHRSYKIENTGSTARWLKIDMAHIGNQNLGVIFEYTAKYSSRPADLDGIKGDPQ